MTKTTNIHRTEQYPASAIFQNHLDVIQGILELYCEDNKGYRWGIVYGAKRIGAEDGAAIKYLKKYEPDNLKFFVVSRNNKSELMLCIDNGISISIKNGTHELYGLFTLLTDNCDLMSSPHLIAFLRRYWLISLLVAGMAIPILLILLSGGGWWSLTWVVVGGLIEAAILAFLLDTSDWDDYILSTKIHYGELGKRTLGPLVSVFGSVRVVISLLASLATVVTFLIFVATRR